MTDAIISNHAIIKKVGAGGMGDVYLAEDIKLRRRVALKFLSEKFFDDEEQRARFLREARNAASLNHPNICTVFQVGEVESDVRPLQDEPSSFRAGTPFLAMELVEGKTLSEVILESGPMSPPQLMELGIQITEGLAEAHRQGIVHRDLKPGNIMLTSAGRIKILDFGLAKALETAANPDTTPGDPLMTREIVGQTANLTGEHAIIGTPAYMSPEQAMGQKVDLRSDVFSLGLILSEMASGQQAFTGPSAMSVLAKVIETDPPPLIRPDLPLRFVSTVNRCLNKAPADRFADGGEVLASLKASQPSAAPDPGLTTEVIEKPVDTPRSKSGRRLALLMGGGLLAGLIGVLGVLQLVGGAGDSEFAAETKTLAVVPFTHIGESGKEYVARGISEEITGRLSLLHELDVISSSSASRYEGKSTEDIVIGLGVDYVLDGSVQWAGTSLRIKCSLSQSDGVIKWSQVMGGSPDSIFALQAEIAETVAIELDHFLEPKREAPTANKEAYDNYLKGLEAAGRRLDEQAVRNAIGFFARATTADSTFALAWSRLSTSLSWEYWAGFSIDDSRMGMALRAARKAVDLEPQLPEAHLALGYYHYRAGLEYDEALRELQIAREGMPGNSDLLLAIGAVLRRQGDVDGSLTYFRQASRLDPVSGYKAWESGETLRLLRRFTEAENQFRRALHVDPDAGYVNSSLGELYLLGLGDPQRARDALSPPFDEKAAWVRTASYLFEEEWGEALGFLSLDHFAHEAPYYLFLLWIRDLQGITDTRQAAADSLRVLLERDRADLEEDPNYYSLLGLAHAGLGEHNKAVQLGAEAVKRAAGDAIMEAEMQFQLAWIYTLSGNIDKAIGELETLLAKPSLVTRARLRVDPTFRVLRGVQQFQTLLAETPDGI